MGLAWRTDIVLVDMTGLNSKVVQTNLVELLNEVAVANVGAKAEKVNLVISITWTGPTCSVLGSNKYLTMLPSFASFASLDWCYLQMAH